MLKMIKTPFTRKKKVLDPNGSEDKKEKGTDPNGSEALRNGYCPVYTETDPKMVAFSFTQIFI